MGDDKLKSQKELQDKKRAELEERIAELEESIASDRRKVAILQNQTAPIVYEYTIEAYDQRKSGGYRYDPFVSKKTITLREGVPERLLEELYAWVHQRIDITKEEITDLKEQLNKL